jgi:hypothetical protein
MAEAPNHHGKHEESDVSVRGIVWSLVILSACGIVLHFTMTGLWWFFGQTMAPKDAVSPWAGPRELPPSPRLQVAPVADLQTYTRTERERLSSYGIDAESGAVHIPIERAMELVVQRGLPVRKMAAAPASLLPSHDGSGGAPVKPANPNAIKGGTGGHVP